MITYIISPQALSRHGLSLAAKLKEAGYRCRYATSDRVAGGFEFDVAKGSDIVIVFLGYKDPAAALIAGYFAGSGRDLIFVAESRQDVPAPLLNKPIIFIDNGGSFRDAVLEKLRSLRPKASVPSTAEKDKPLEFLRWLSEDPERINHLSSVQFEELVRILLAGVSLRNSRSGEGVDSNNFIVQYKRASEAYFRFCHSPLSEKLSFREIQDTSEAASSSGSDFALLITTNGLTPAAAGHTFHCYPSVRVVDQDAIIDAIRERLDARAGGKRLLDGWVKSSLKMERSEPLALWHGDPHQRIGKYEVGRVFVAAAADDPDDLGSLVGSFEKCGAKVWHNSRSIETGTWCRSLEEIATAVRASGTIVVFLGKKDKAPSTQDQAIRTVALELFKRDVDKMLIVLGHDRLWNRLKLPRIFDESLYVDVGERDWIPRVLRIWSDEKNE